MFFHFISNVLAQRAGDGAAAAGNWRFIAHARDMAVRLGLNDLADMIAGSEDALRQFDPAVLDQFDAGDLADPKLHEQIDTLLNSGYFELVEQASRPIETGDPSVPLVNPVLHILLAEL